MLCFWLFSNHKGRSFLLCCFLFNLQNNCKVLEWLQYPLQHECFLSSREMLMVSLGWLSDSLFVENSWFLFSFFLLNSFGFLWSIFSATAVNMLNCRCQQALRQSEAWMGLNDPWLCFVCHEIIYLVYNYLVYSLTWVFDLICAYLLKELDPVWERCKTVGGSGV